ncbi:unnamed protein product, partial [Brassica oleracea]
RHHPFSSPASVQPTGFCLRRSRVLLRRLTAGFLFLGGGGFLSSASPAFVSVSCLFGVDGGSHRGYPGFF